MKTNLFKSLLLLVGAATAIGAAAETPREVAPLLTEGKSWLMLESRAIPDDGIGAYYTLEVSGDTVVDGYTCKRVVKTYVGREKENKTIYAFREADGRIYAGAGTLLMDFSCTTGDKVPILGTDASLEVLRENTLTVNGEVRRELIIGYTGYDGKQQTCGSWVEGIGAPGMDSFPIDRVFPTWTYGWINDDIMIACYEDGKQIFSREDFSYRPALPREPAKLLTDGKSWRVGVHITDTFGEVHERTVEYDIAVCGDTIVGGKACKLIESCPVDEPTKKNRFVGYEENGRVYNVAIGGYDTTWPEWQDATFQPLMDFTYLPNDKVAEYEPTEGLFTGYSKEVSRVDVKVIDGKPYREIVIPQPGSSLPSVCWVEGIGANYSEYTTWLTSYPIAGDGKSLYTYMIECRQDGRVIFTQSDFTHPLADIRELTADAEANGALYDLLGRRVATPAPGHIYIKNGRKHLAR